MGKPKFDKFLGKLREADFTEEQLDAILHEIALCAKQRGTYPELIVGGLIARESDAVIDLRTSFIFRSAGGNESIATGAAKITEIDGNVVNGIPFTPDKFKSIGFNAFNPQNVLDKTINQDGSIEDSQSHKMIYVHVIACSAGTGHNNGYIISSKESSSITVNRVAFTTSDPDSAQSATVLSATQIDAARSSYIPPQEGWLLIDCNADQLEDMCVHLAWSYNPHNWLEYSESVIELPTVHDWGMGKAGNVYDEINFLDQQIITRINRALMNELDWTEHKTDGTTIYSNAEETEAIGSVEALGEDSITLQGNVYTRDTDHDTASAYAWTYDGTTVYTATDSPVADSYTYTTEDIKDDIKASTANISAYGLSSGFTLAVSAEGILSLSTGSTRITPATDLAGIYAYYEIATEIIQPEELNPIYEVHDFGTEEFIGTEVAPMYATFFYLPNLYDNIRQIIYQDHADRTVTIDFGEIREVCYKRNMVVNMVMKSFVCDNVNSLKIYINGSVVQTFSSVTDGTTLYANISVNQGDKLAFEITRNNYNENAQVNYTYTY